MATVKLSQALRDEYENLFNTCIIQPSRAGVVEDIISKIQVNTRGNRGTFPALD